MKLSDHNFGRTEVSATLAMVLQELKKLQATIGTDEYPSDRSEQHRKAEDFGPSRSNQAHLPLPEVIASIIENRRKRSAFFAGNLFADPAWDMILDLAFAKVKRKRVSVTSLCIASGVPPTTALRYISKLVEAGIFERQQDECDARRAFISLSDHATKAVARYFAECDIEDGIKAV